MRSTCHRSRRKPYNLPHHLKWTDTDHIHRILECRMEAEKAQGWTIAPSSCIFLWDCHLPSCIMQACSPESSAVPFRIRSLAAYPQSLEPLLPTFNFVSCLCSSRSNMHWQLSIFESSGTVPVPVCPRLVISLHIATCRPTLTNRWFNERHLIHLLDHNKWSSKVCPDPGYS